MITYSDNARLVLQRANELAVRTGGLVCTEHILFGLLDVDGSAAQRLLNGCGVYEEDVIPVFSPMPTRPVVEMSARASRAVQNAKEVAARLGSQVVARSIFYIRFWTKRPRLQATFCAQRALIPNICNA